MNFTEFREILTSVTYKPTWTVTLVGEEYLTESKRYSVNLTYSVPVVDVNDGKPVHLFTPYTITFHESATREAIAMRVFAGFLAAETHEAREQFRLDRVAIYNPHGSEGNALWHEHKRTITRVLTL